MPWILLPVQALAEALAPLPPPSQAEKLGCGRRCEKKNIYWMDFIHTYIYIYKDRSHWSTASSSNKSMTFTPNRTALGFLPDSQPNPKSRRSIPETHPCPDRTGRVAELHRMGREWGSMYTTWNQNHHGSGWHGPTRKTEDPFDL